MARLVIITADGRNEVELQPHNSVGRHPNNTIQILDRIASKEHCRIQLENGGYVLHDLGSLNGTYVNSARVSQHNLQTGDEILIGSTKLLFLDRISSDEMLGRVTMTPGMLQSHIRTKLAPQVDQSFVPEKAIQDIEHLRRDYEKLRIGYELQRSIGIELDLDKLLGKILDRAFEMLAADRGVVLLFDDNDQLQPRAVKTRKARGDENIVLSSSIINEVVREKAAVLSSDAAIDSRFKGSHSVIMQGIRSTMAVPIIVGGQLFGIMILDSQIATNAFGEKDLQLFTGIANQAALSIQNVKLAKKIEAEAQMRAKFERMMSPILAEQVLSGKLEVTKGGELREATVLFADIRGFTPLSEGLGAQDVVAMLNEYFEMMIEIVFHNEGTLDKFIGDEIMVLYGAPTSRADDPVRAVRTALEMQAALIEFNRTRQAEGMVPILIGVGINTGEVVAGYMGSTRTMEYTAIGDTVNTGSRLCSIAKAGEIIVSESTWARVESQFEAVPLAPTKVKGKAAPLRIFNVTSVRRTFTDEITNPGAA